MDCSPEGALFREIHLAMVRNFVSCSVSVSVYPRGCNRVADSMDNHGVAAFPDGGQSFWC